MKERFLMKEYLFSAKTRFAFLLQRKEKFFSIVHFYGGIREGSDSLPNPSKPPITLLNGHCGGSPPPAWSHPR
jgi:hypothetical protein